MSDLAMTQRKDSFTIPMPIDTNMVAGNGLALSLMSPTHRVDGLGWSVHATPNQERTGLTVAIHCDSDGLCVLWRAKTKIVMRIGAEIRITGASETFSSWNRNGNKHELTPIPFATTDVSVDIETEVESSVARPILHPESFVPDVTLVLEGRKFHVNKELLSTQSSYFDRLFNCDFKESKQDEIEIKNIDPEHFHELLNIIYGDEADPTTVENAIRYLEMADMFDLQIVKDRIEFFLISTDLISIHRKFLIADHHKLEMLKNVLIDVYSDDEEKLLELKISPEFDEFPESVKNLLLGDA